MVKKKIQLLFPLLLGFLLIISGCDSNSDPATDNQKDIINNLVSYKDSDYYTNWKEDTYTSIRLEGSTATVDGDNGVVVENNQILIRTSGTYIVKGTLNDGQIVVNAEDSGDVRLVLNGATIKSSTSAPIYIIQADKTIISLEEDTENILSDASEYVYENDSTDEPSATIYSKDDLTINGSGSLTIEGNYNDGIKGNDDLKIIGGSINVTSSDDGIVGRDLLAVKDSMIYITSGGDGLKASNDEDEVKGNMIIESGEFTIQAEGDGIQAEKILAIADGKYSITAGGGSPETITNAEAGNMRGPGMTQGNGTNIQQEAPPESSSDSDSTERQSLEPPSPPTGQSPQLEEPNGIPPQENTNEVSGEQNSEEETISTKGIKAGTSLYVIGGTLKIDSLEDAVHSNQDVIISGGTMNISTGDDGIHGDQEVMLNGGEISIDKSLEGIEGKNIIVADGTYHVVAEDDGINVNGGSDAFGMPGGFGNMYPSGTKDTMNTENNLDAAATTEDKNNNTTKESTNEESTDEGLLLIEGGYLFVNANGDGLDSNTSAKMTGGTVIVYGPTNNGNAPLDYNNSFVVEGGTLIASGSSGMAQGISEDSSQPGIMMTFSDFQEANTTVYVTDEKGEEVIAIAPEKQFQSILVSSPDLELDQTYTFHWGGVLSGDNVNGFYSNASYKEGTSSFEFPLSTIMTYLNEDGVTEGNSNGMMNGNPFGGENRRRSE